MDLILISNCIGFPTAKAVPRHILMASTLHKFYDLERKVTRLEQRKESIENIYYKKSSRTIERNWFSSQKFNEMWNWHTGVTLFYGRIEFIHSLIGYTIVSSGQDPMRCVSNSAISYSRASTWTCFRKDLMQTIMLAKGDTMPSDVMFSEEGNPFWKWLIHPLFHCQIRY